MDDPTPIRIFLEDRKRGRKAVDGGLVVLAGRSDVQRQRPLAHGAFNRLHSFLFERERLTGGLRFLAPLLLGVT
jgi:hypothetical protein